MRHVRMRRSPGGAKRERDESEAGLALYVVYRTNVFIAAFISHGVCNELLEHCVLNHQVVLSTFILNELKDKLTGKFKFTVFALLRRGTFRSSSYAGQPGFVSLTVFALLRRGTFRSSSEKWWAMTDLNRRHSRCKRDALPTELIALAK